MRIAPPDAVDSTLLRRVLVIKLRHHGDVLLASPVFTALKSALSAAEIDALVYAETAPMLEGHPAISRLHTIDREWKRRGAITQARAEIGLLRALRSRGYDLVVHLTEHPRGAWLTRLLRPRYAVARELPQAHWLWRTSFTHYYRLPRATARHTVECNLDALRRLGLQPAPDERRLVLVTGASDIARAAALMTQHGLEKRGFIQLHPGSRWMFKCWTAEAYAGLVDRLAAEGSWIAIPGAPDRCAGCRHALERRRSRGPTELARAGGADARGALVRRCGLGADAHRRRRRNSCGRAVRTERRGRVGAVAGASSRGRLERSSVPALRQRRLRRREGIRMSHHAAGRARARRRARAAGADLSSRAAP